ncbi:MAG TPA: type IV pilus assembly protein PilM [Solirubrobacterales bacterium]
MKLSLKKPTISKPTLSLSKPSFSLGRSGNSETTLVGLEIEAGSIAAAEVHANGAARVGAVAVQSLPAGAFEDGEVVDPDEVTAALRTLFSANKLSKRVRLGIANQRVVVRTVRLPAIEDPQELDSAVRFSAQEQIAMPLDQAMIDHRVIGGSAPVDGAPPQIDVMVVAARRDMIAASLKPLRDAGLEPVGVDLSAFGMIRALGEAALPAAQPGEAPSQAAVLYCNIGDVTNLAVAKGRSCLFTRISPVGLDDMTSGLAARTQLSIEHARMWLEYTGLERPLEAIEGDPAVLAAAREALELGADSLLDELRLSLDFYGAQDAAVPVERIVLCGPGSAVDGIAARLEPSLGVPVSTGRPEALGDLDASSAARLTLPYGIALEH